MYIVPQHRHIASALVAALVLGALSAGLAVGARPSVPAIGISADPTGVCPENRMPTRWKDEFHPPSTIRVRRTSGPAGIKDTVQTVDFWKYVGTVLRTEFSGGGFNDATMRAGALAVKQYAWYYTIIWRGGKITLADGSVDCYDVIDTTADQLYKPEKQDANGNWVPRNEPSQTNLDAMAATWHIGLRKDFLKKKRKPNKLFLTGYRSGSNLPCGYEDGWFRLYQKSLKDCGIKGLTTEEIWRTYYGSNLYIPDVRDHDMLFDNGEWRGDVGVLTADGGNTDWALFAATSNGFASPRSGSLSVAESNIRDQAVGDVTGTHVPRDDLNDPNDGHRKPFRSNNLGDLVLLLDSPRSVLVVKATGDSDAPFSTLEPIDAAGAERILVADFDGDMNADIGLLRSTATAPAPDQMATLRVVRSTGDGTFAAPADWWRGALDLSARAVMAGDTNSDGKADLIFSDGTVHRVALSPASCLDLSVSGPCTDVPGFNLDDAVTAMTLDTGWALGDVQYVVGDYNRDGRDDVFAVVEDGAGTKVIVLRAKPDGTFENLGSQWQSAGVSFGAVRAVAFHGNADGFADLAMVQNTSSGQSLFWLQASPTGMTAVGTPVTSGQSNWPDASASF